MADTVIIGAGVIGLSTAFYPSFLNQSKAKIYVIDSSPELFQCASGLAGGFLASDWFAPQVAPLGALSFKLHRELASQFNGAELWGYSSSAALSLSKPGEEAVGGSGEDWLLSGASRASAAADTNLTDADRPPWLHLAREASLDPITRASDVAQLDPLKLARFLLQKCRDRGVDILNPVAPIAVCRDDSARVTGLRVRHPGEVEATLECSRIVIAAGAWSPSVFKTLFPTAKTDVPVSSLAGHSLLLETKAKPTDDPKLPCHAVFSSDEEGFSPEIFSRSGGEIYLAGLNTTQLPLPTVASDAQPVPEAMEKLRAVALKMIDGGLANYRVVRESLCFRPVSSSGRPIIGRISNQQLGHGPTAGDSAIFMATGHGAWGISQCLGTGLVLAELMENKPLSASISGLGLT